MTGGLMCSMQPPHRNSRNLLQLFESDIGILGKNDIQTGVALQSEKGAVPAIERLVAKAAHLAIAGRFLISGQRAVVRRFTIRLVNSDHRGRYRVAGCRFVAASWNVGR